MSGAFRKLYTEAGERLKNDPATIPWDEYPRPHLRRGEWLNLNGLWEIETESGDRGKVRVPFPLESLLSGYDGVPLSPIGYGGKLVYSRSFTVPGAWSGRRIVLNFGAVSRECTVMVNGREAARSSSAYLPFSADVTDSLINGENRLEVVCANDLSPVFPSGKQRIKRGGMWYTPCTGIWQTVWLEPVPKEHIEDISCVMDLSGVTVTVSGVSEGEIVCEGKRYALSGGVCRIEPESPRLWSPEEPNLYGFTVRSGEDEAGSYFALRTIETKTVSGVPRLCLNGKPYFFNGLLDQGYFSDGLWTPAEPAEYERDILRMKSLGFNTLRKHIKIEPELFYYCCDRLGMAVFQDMVNNGRYSYFRDTVLPTIGINYLPLPFLTELDDRHFNRDRASRMEFLSHMRRTVGLLSSHPSIVYWTVFNEGWGQFLADEAYGLLKELDPTRVIDTTSGWFHRKRTDADSQHIYFKKQRLGRRRELPQVISEFGGYVWKIPEHSFNAGKTYGYKIFETREELAADIARLYSEEILPLVGEGLSAAVYTQVSDVEDETNGLLTYDRRVMKLDPEELRGIAERIKEAIEL